MVLVEQDVGNFLSDTTSKIRSLETKNNILAEHILNVNQNTIEEYKRINKEIASINEDIKKIKEELFNLKQILRNFLSETEIFAKKTDVKVLEKYINLWNPLEFVREEDIDKIIEYKLKNLSLEKESVKKKGGKTGRK